MDAAADPGLNGSSAPPQNPYQYGVPNHEQPLHQNPQYPPYYAYYPNPNPNPNPNPVSMSYTPHGGYIGHQETAYSNPPPPGTYSYPLPAAAAAPAEEIASYYHYQTASNYAALYPGAVPQVERPKIVEDLETKKRKLIQAGTAVVAVRSCTVCNIVCNNDKALAAHLAGEKHAIKAFGKPTNPKKPKVAKVVGLGAVMCEVCKLECNSQEVLNIHKTGKKHKKNLQKLQGLITAKPTIPTPVSGTAAPTVKKTATPQDLLKKKQNLLNSGTAANSIRECTICHVVCTSQSVLDSHLAGQKHAAMVAKKQTQHPALLC